MLYALKIATRYLTASKAQTALLVFGVAVGVFIFIFMSALIGGLAEFILSRTVGDMSHVTIEAEDARPALLISPEGHASGLAVRTGRTAPPRWPKAADLAAADRGRAGRPRRIAADHRRGVPDARGAGVAGQRDGGGAGARIRDPRPRRLHGRRHGAARLRPDPAGPRPGRRPGAVAWARRCGCNPRTGSRVLTLSGIYETGNGALDGSSAFVSLSTARTLFAMPQGVTRIEIKLTT
jgi:lipoprotein-releasing system permease protein